MKSKSKELLEELKKARSQIQAETMQESSFSQVSPPPKTPTDPIKKPEREESTKSVSFQSLPHKPLKIKQRTTRITHRKLPSYPKRSDKINFGLLTLDAITAAVAITFTLLIFQKL